MDKRVEGRSGRVGTHQPTLMLTASLLKEESVPELMWVASVDCTINSCWMRTSWLMTLAYRSLIILGKSIVRQRLQ